MVLKHKIVAALAALSLLGGSGLAGKSYFDKHYVLLNEEDQMAIMAQIMLITQAAYESGVQACTKPEIAR